MGPTVANGCQLGAEVSKALTIFPEVILGGAKVLWDLDFSLVGGRAPGGGV